MGPGIRTSLALLTLAVGPAAAPPQAAPPAIESPSADGYLKRRVEILVYPADPVFETSARGWTLQRETSLFEGYLWRYSGRRLAVDARVTIVHRALREDEFRDYGKQFGFLLDRSPRVEADLASVPDPAPSLLLLYDPPADRPNQIAGRTFFEGSHSAIPLGSRYFQEEGFFRPLHLVMVHEYLHQIDLDFSRIHRPAEFLDPDGAGQVDYPACIDSGGGDLSMRSLLRFNRSCGPVDWALLAPTHGTWIARVIHEGP